MLLALPRVRPASLALVALVGCTTAPDDLSLARVAPSSVDVDVQKVELQDGAPYFARGLFGTAGTIRDTKDAAADPKLGAALVEIAAVFQISADQLVPVRVTHDQLGWTHVIYEQRVHGLRIVGGDLAVHITADGAVRVANGTVRDARAASTIPLVSALAAADVARRATAAGQSDAGEPELVFVVSAATHTLHLAWSVPVQGRDELLFDRVFVDAREGRVVDRRPEVYTARNRTVFDGHGGTVPFTQSTQVGTEASPPTEAVARAAYDNTGATYDCYHDLFNRDSYDGTGGTLKSLVHIVFPNGQGGTTGNNAAWNNNQMMYGDGDGTLMGPTPLGFDVTAHELTHGVTSRTANLTYQGESGALNEGMSDIMAAACEVHKLGSVSARTWLIGEDIFTPATAGDALRYMADPSADAALYPPAIGGSRDFYADRYTGTQDNGGVHLNSGIANLAFQLLVAGGSHPRNKTTFTVPAIGMEHGAAIFERALTNGYFTSGTKFAQARTATEQAATDLYAAGPDKTAVSIAWAAVGVGAPPAGVDVTPPTVAITSPANGATVAAGFAVDVTATDDVGVTRVELAVDGAMVASSTSAPYQFTTDAALAAGSHTVKATAFDSSNQASATVTVTIDVASQPPNNNDPDGSDDTGCCSSSRRSGVSSGLLAVMAALLLRRRRAR